MPRILIRIEVDTPPFKTTYFAGEFFNSAGMVVRAYYTGGYSEIVTTYFLAPTIALTADDSQISINYQGKTAYQPITVYGSDYLSIITPPTKTVYQAGDHFEPYGMVVKLFRINGNDEIINSYSYSPQDCLTTNQTNITISYLNLTVNQPITVNNPPTKGYFVDKYLGNANYGNNPYINTVDGSISFYNNPITIERDSYQLNVVLSYYSRMTNQESDLIKGLFKGFRTNFHQFLIADGVDENNNTMYKYIDGNGYIHTFVYHSELNKYYDKEGTGLCLDINDKTIKDEQNNILTFDTSGRLISIESGLNPFDVKIIEYNSDGLRKIYDNRNPNVYIKFSYYFSFLQFIRVYYNNDSAPLKTYTFNGFFGQISSIEETVGNNTRTLYQYEFNDRDRIRRVVDCLNKVAYQITYTFDTILNDYRFDSLKKGYLNNDTFVQHEGIYFVRYNYDTESPYQLIYEFVIRNDDDIDLSFMTDSNSNPVSVFEQEYNNVYSYHSLTKDAGIWLDNQGSSGVQINDSIAKSFLGTINISNISIPSTAFNESPFIKLTGYIKLKDHPLRAKLSVSDINLYLTSKSIDINPDAYYVWQYFEIDIERSLGNNNKPIAFYSFNISLVDESDDDLEADIVNLYIAKSQQRQKLYFLNNDSPFVFDDIKYIKLLKNNNTYETINMFATDIYMSETDLINTFKYYYRHQQDNIHLAYFNNGKVIKTYRIDDIRGLDNNNNALYFLDTSIVNNDILGADTNWFFATALDAKVKTFYNFKATYYEIAVQTKTNDDPVTYETTITRYDYNNQIVLEINKNNIKTHYEYFADGTLKKKGIGDFDNDGITFIYSAILYEASLDANNKYIGRTNQEGRSFDYQYSNGLLSKKIINDLYQGQPVNQYFSIEYTRDGFLSDLSNVKFKNINTVEEEHNYSRPSVSYKTNYINDTVSKYRINKNIDSQSTVLGIHNGTDYVNILTTQKTASSIKRTYNNSHSGVNNSQVVTETFDVYNRPASIIVDNVVKVTFQYESNNESHFCSLLSGINDNFTGRNISYTYDGNNEVSSIEADDFTIAYSTDGDYSCTELAFDNTEIYLSKAKDKEVLVEKNNATINSTYWKYQYDNLLRLSSKTMGNDSNTVHNYSYDANYPSRIASYSYNNSVYSESYSYGQFYGYLTGVSISTTNFSSVSTYQYDGFGRLISETNTKLGINRTYIYKSSSNIPGPVGRMTKFGLNEMSYDDRGRLTAFDDITFEYDEYGNRVKKTIDNTTYITYEYERGKLLSSINSNASFQYDYQCLRSSKSDGDGLTHKYYYNDNNLVGEDVYNGNALVRRLRFFYDKDGLCALRLINSDSSYTDYIYIRNPFNDIVGIMDDSTLEAIYVYDAWGNHRVYKSDGTVDDDLTSVGNLNPFRYRSYYYDSDTKLYYLKARYYDPEIGQFISPDDMDYLSIEDITGVDLYAYCHNNPVMNYDPSGHLLLSMLFGLLVTALAFPTKEIGGIATQALASIVSYGYMLVSSLFDKEIMNDMLKIGFNPFNTDVSSVLSSKKVSFYKGVPIFRTNNDRSGFFGAIFLKQNESENDLKHEYGHSFQQLFLGPLGYALCIVIPSYFEWGVDKSEGNYEKSYYHRPWEALASIMGGDSRFSYTSADFINAFYYIVVARLFGILCYRLSFNK